jgi:hypothetical protein
MMSIRKFGVVVGLSLALPGLAFSQAPPGKDQPIRPKAKLNDSPQACVYTREAIGRGNDVDVKKSKGKSLSEQLAHSNGVICPPSDIDREMRKPAAPTGTMPVIPPPGSPGGNPRVQPK